MKNNRLDMLKYIVISILIFVLSVIVSNFMRIVLTDDKLFSFTFDKATLIASMVEGAVGAIAAGFVLYELKLNGKVRERENDIEEAQFLLEFNQAFIQDQKMSDTEGQLEKWMLEYQNNNCINSELVTDDNRQTIINYLVYLEGFAPLIFRGILKLEHIDNLMAYRFFVALNNPCIQKDQIFVFPEYYRGCIKLYKIWKEYRENNGLPILLNEFSLDLWDKFIIYSSDANVRKCNKNDDYRKISELIYDTDHYIYPAAFGNKHRAECIIPQLIEKRCIFNYENIRVAIDDGKICGIALVISGKKFLNKPDYFLNSKSKNAQKAYDDYFAKIGDVVKDDQVYIACICVDKRHRGKGIGEILLKSIITEFDKSKLILDVLADNKNAIRLYKKCGFVESKRCDGFSIGKKKPLCEKMIRIPNRNSNDDKVDVLLNYSDV